MLARWTASLGKDAASFEEAGGSDGDVSDVAVTCVVPLHDR